MDKVKELVEWVADIIDTEMPHTTRVQFVSKAKQILSHPDLALILKPQYIDWGTEPEKLRLSTVALVIPLAEALKEAQK